MTATAVKSNITIVVPTYNEAENVKPFIEEIATQLAKTTISKACLIFVDDGSHDRTWQTIKSQADQILSNECHLKVCGISFSRNFGKECALTAGVNYSKQSDATITMDVDLQHPPSLIPQMLEQWHRGVKTVIAIKETTNNRHIVHNIFSTLFYVISRSSEFESKSHNTDFRLFDRVVVEAICELQEHQRLFRGLADWVGFDREYIKFKAPTRSEGVSRFGLSSLLRLAKHSTLAFARWPSILPIYAGLVTLVFFASIAIHIDLTRGDVHENPLFENNLILAINTMILFFNFICFLGISVVLGSINNQVRRRPLYIIQDKHNID